MNLQEIGKPIIIKQKNFTSKQITLGPPSKHLLTYGQIREFCKNIEKNAPKGSKMVVRALNILKNTTLYSTYGKKWDTDEEHIDYWQTMAEESGKFQEYFNFTITLKTPN